MQHTADAATFAALCVTVLSSNILVANAITYDSEGMPVSLTGDEFIIVRDSALSDPRVQELIDGRNYSVTDCCGFLKPNATASWEPVINIRVANEMQIAIRVNLDSQEVTAIETMPATETGPAVNESDNNPNNSSEAIPAIIGIGAAIAGVFALFTLTKRRR